jgi:hypothetical protein
MCILLLFLYCWCIIEEVDSLHLREAIQAPDDTLPYTAQDTITLQLQATFSATAGENRHNTGVCVIRGKTRNEILLKSPALTVKEPGYLSIPRRGK